MFLQLACTMVNKYLQMGDCVVSEVKVETLYLLEIQQCIDKFPPSERTTTNTALLLMEHFWTTFLTTCAQSIITISLCGYDFDIKP